MASLTMTDVELAEKFCRRTPGQPLFEPCEFGYRCPRGHKGMQTTWSEFREHIWCRICEIDYLYYECLLQRPSWMTPQQFREFRDKLPRKPRTLPGVDRYIELLDKTERKLKE